MAAELGTVGIRVATGGSTAQVAGFTIDAWLHSRDPGLSVRESVFTLGNAGHALVAAGLLLVVLGVGIAWAGFRAVPAVGLATVAVVVALGATVGTHTHDTDRAVEEARARAARVIPGLAHGHGPERGPTPVDRETRATLASQLVEARAFVLRYPTVAYAEAAGYRLVVPYVPLIGAHYLRADRLGGPFDVERPAILLFDGTDPDSAVVGLSYYVASQDPPVGFAGSDDHWHRHVGLCLNERLVVVGGERLSDAQCDALGGHRVNGTDGWMVHAWVVPGWESPDGVFSAENRLLL